MKKMRFILLAICGGLLISSCSKEQKCKLDTLSVTDGVAVTYEYDDQNRISKINQYDPLNANVLTSYYVVNRNADGKILSVDYRSASGLAIYYYSVAYNSNGNMGAIYTFEDTQGDFIADELYSSILFYYGGDSKVDSTVMSFGGGFKRSTTFSWTGDNVTGITHQFNDALQYSKTFAYDNLDNAFESLAEVNLITLFDIGEPNVQSLSKNNIIEMSHYDAGYNLLGTYNYTFFQSSAGHIEIINGNVFLGYYCE